MPYVKVKPAGHAAALEAAKQAAANCTAKPHPPAAGQISSKHDGVRISKEKRWQALVRLEGVEYSMGTFGSEQAAADAVAAAKAVRDSAEPKAKKARSHAAALEAAKQAAANYVQSARLPQVPLVLNNSLLYSLFYTLF